MVNKIKTPVLDKMVLNRDESQILGQFLEWLSEQKIELAKWDGGEHIERLDTIRDDTEQLLAKYFGVDLVKAEKERQALIDSITH